jgi:hypothetical protein
VERPRTWTGDPFLAVNPSREGRSGSHLMIGPCISGRYWTIVVMEVDDALGLWRPITGWPSTEKEIKAWHAR